MWYISRLAAANSSGFILTVKHTIPCIGHRSLFIFKCCSVRCFFLRVILKATKGNRFWFWHKTHKVSFQLIFARFGKKIKIKINPKIRNDLIARALVCSLLCGNFFLSLLYVLCFAGFLFWVSTYCRISVHTLHRILLYWLHAMRKSNIYYFRHRLNYNISYFSLSHLANFV